MGIKADFFKGKQIRITFCKIGNIFNPVNQKRTDPLDDIAEKDREKKDEKLRKAFNMGGKDAE